LAIKLNSFAKEKIRNAFLVPDYYKHFSCKGGECRDSCCADWKVTIPMDQYFLLHGLSCNKNVKEKIDRTFRPLFNTTPERYAEIVHTQDGDCPLHKKDGYCLLHETCGEEVLPWVCRYYPRGPRIDYAFEASCANSCEKTLELLLENDEILKFETINLSFLMKKTQKEISIIQKHIYIKVRDNCFKLLSDRKYSLALRILHLGIYLKSLESNIETKITDLDFSLVQETKDVNSTYLKLFEIFSNFNGRFPRLVNLLEEVKMIYENHDIEEVYQNNLQHFEDIFTNNEIMFEKMLINDLFFKQFPFQSNLSFFDQFISICGSFMLLRYLSINLMWNKSFQEDLIDILSRTFTVISHSEFDRQLLNYLEKAGLNNMFELSKILFI